jgi:hypothetical protein
MDFAREVQTIEHNARPAPFAPLSRYGPGAPGKTAHGHFPQAFYFLEKPTFCEEHKYKNQTIFGGTRKQFQKQKFGKLRCTVIQKLKIDDELLLFLHQESITKNIDFVPSGF